MRVQSFALCCLLLAVGLEACKITVKVRSRTETPFRFQMFIPAIHQQSELITFTGKGDRDIKIQGKDCNTKHWTFKTWKQTAAGEWVPAKETKGKYEGEGWFRVIIDSDLAPFLYDRQGIMCSEGTIGGC
uniref:PUD1_2 domain-containing protein n=1 Tax=Steinernema glaseri TaxID=37863 RepID=A0A1I7Y793_9BILA